MKKLENRAILCLTLVAALVLGLGYFVVKLEINGSSWASFYANSHIFSGGELSVGSVYDRNGVCLLKNASDGPHYNDSEDIRRATLHVVGDRGYNISTAANNVFRDKMAGYNPVTGTNPLLTGALRRVNLTIDSDVSVAAYKALAGRNGFVGVYNYKTGEIVSAVSSPTMDPSQKVDASQMLSGTFINKVFSSTFTPGSTFKLVTAAAAIENIPDIDTWTYTCNGTCYIEGQKVTCPHAHGTMDFYGCLANSCNGAFATLAVKVGPQIMKSYTEQCGLTDVYDIDGIKSAAGSFNFDTYNINIGWAGIGQFEDQVNPLSMMVYMGAIAGEGEAAAPYICDRGILGGSAEASADKVKLLNPSTARKLKDMMRNNVKSNYGDNNYPGLELCAKSGTAEVGNGKAPHSWFCGFCGDYAFVVCVENGGYGAQVAGPVTNQVMQIVMNGSKD